MKKRLLYIILLASLFLSTACTNMQIGFEEDSPFYDGGVIYIYLDEDVSSDTSYRVYINNEDSEVRLIPGTEARFGVDPQEIKIEIVKEKESASIHLNLQKSKSYYLRVKESYQGELEIIEVDKNTFKSDQEREESTDELKNAEDIKEGEVEFYYDPNE